MADLLLELFSEEIPARMQARAAEDQKRLVGDELGKANLAFGSASAFVTPRRLALAVDGLPLQQPDVTEERKGPRVGSPLKFHRSASNLGVQVTWSQDKRAVKGGSHRPKLPEPLIAERNLLEYEKVTRIQRECSLQTPRGFVPETLASVDIAR